MKFSDIQECSKCGGNGLKSQKNKLTSLIEIVSCPHCQGTGQEPIRVAFDVPDGYEVYSDVKDRHITFIYKEQIWTKQEKYPYRTGDELTLVCDSCGGRGKQKRCNKPHNFNLNNSLCRSVTNTNYCLTCKFNYLINCPTCQGTPNKTIKITEVRYKLIGSEHGVNVYYEVKK